MNLNFVVSNMNIEHQLRNKKKYRVCGSLIFDTISTFIITNGPIIDNTIPPLPKNPNSVYNRSFDFRKNFLLSIYYFFCTHFHDKNYFYRVITCYDQLNEMMVCNFFILSNFLLITKVDNMQSIVNSKHKINWLIRDIYQDKGPS